MRGYYIEARVSLKNIRIALTLLLVPLLLFASFPKADSQYLFEEEGISGYAEVFIEEPDYAYVYLYINYSSDPPALLVELPIEPFTENLDIVSGNALSAIYAGGGYALILTNVSRGSVVIRYRASVDSLDSVILVDIRSPQWAGYTEIYLKKELVEKMVSNNNIINFSGETYVEKGIYLAYRLPSNSSLEIQLHVESSRGIDYRIPIIATGALLAIIAVVTITRLSRKPFLEELDAVDREILRIIRDLGGEATMSMIIDRSNIPRTTLWRRVKKLNRLGYVDVLKVGRSSLVRVRRARSEKNQ